MSEVKEHKQHSRIHVVLTPSQKQIIRSEARKRGLTLSSFMKVAALKELQKRNFAEVN